MAHEFPPFASDTLRTPPPGRLANFSPPSGRDFTPRFAAPLRRRILEGEENFGAVAAEENGHHRKGIASRDSTEFEVI